MERRLFSVEQVPEEEAVRILKLPAELTEIVEPEEAEKEETDGR